MPRGYKTKYTTKEDILREILQRTDEIKSNLSPSLDWRSLERAVNNAIYSVKNEYRFHPLITAKEIEDVMRKRFF